MKVRITMKDCNVMYNFDDEVTKAQKAQIAKWFEFGEYADLEFDTNTNEMIILKP